MLAHCPHIILKIHLKLLQMERLTVCLAFMHMHYTVHHAKKADTHCLGFYTEIQLILGQCKYTVQYNVTISLYSEYNRLKLQ